MSSHACVYARVGRPEVAKGYAGAAAAVMCVKGKVPLTNHQNNNTLQQYIYIYKYILLYSSHRHECVHTACTHPSTRRGCIILNVRNCTDLCIYIII